MYKPMLALEVSKPFSDSNWVFEIKWDGFRAIAYVKETFSLRSRNGKELKGTFPEIEELTHLTSNVVVDGEIVIVKEGRVDFQALQKRSQVLSPLEVAHRAKSSPATYVIFDILEKNGKPLVDLPLVERKEILRQSVNEGQHNLISDCVEGRGEEYYHSAVQKGLEGVVAKKKSSLYEQGQRTGAWLKIKNLKMVDCVIFGYTKGEGARQSTFGALVVRLYDKNKKPVFIANVGTGFTNQMLTSFYDRFQGMKIDSAPFSVEGTQNITWVKPTLVCEVIYLEVTSDCRLRAPRFHYLRADKPPNECTLEQLVRVQGQTAFDYA
jgi:DNA ligase D-like protein (predicted ligase)